MNWSLLVSWNSLRLQEEAFDDFREFNFKCIHFTSIKKQVRTTIKKQVRTTYTCTNLSRFCFLGTTPVLEPNVTVWANENPKVDTRCRKSNSAPYGCKTDALPHDHGHHFREFSLKPEV